MRSSAAGRAARDPRSLRLRAARVVALLAALVAGAGGDLRGLAAPLPAEPARRPAGGAPVVVPATVTGLWPRADDLAAPPPDDPTGVALHPNGTLWVVEAGADRLRRFPLEPRATGPGRPAADPDLLGPSLPGAGSGAEARPLRRPQSVAVAPDGTLVVVDTGNHRLLRLSAAGRLLAEYGGLGTDGGRFYRPTAAVVAADGRIVVADTGNHRVQVLTSDGRPLAIIGRLGTGPGALVEPGGVALAPDGTLFVADTGNHRLQAFGPDGRLMAVIGRPGRTPGGFLRPSGLALAPDGTLWVADTGNHRLVRIDRAGRLIGAVGALGRRPGELQEPAAIAVGPDGALYVADTANDRIQRLQVAPAALAAAEGASLYAAGLPALARAAWQRGLRAAPGDPAIEAALGRADLAEGNPARAVERIERALRARPDDPQLHVLLARALSARYAWPLGAGIAAAAVVVAALITRWVAVRRLRELAARHLAAGRRAEAVRTYERVLRLARRDLPSLRALSALYEADGRREAARAAHSHVLRFEADNLPALRFLADHALAREAYEEGAALFGRAVAADPTSAIAQASLGVALAELGDAAGAGRAFAQALALLADLDPAALGRQMAALEARLPLVAGDRPAGTAFAAARRAAAAGHFAQGEAALARGAAAAALVAFGRAACLEPPRADAEGGAALASARGQSAFEAGLAAYRARDYRLAIEFFKAALAFVPAHDGAARHLRYAQQCLDGSFRHRVQHLETGEARE